MFTIFFYNKEEIVPIEWHELILGGDVALKMYCPLFLLFICPLFPLTSEKHLKGSLWTWTFDWGTLHCNTYSCLFVWIYAAFLRFFDLNFFLAKVSLELSTDSYLWLKCCLTQLKDYAFILNSGCSYHSFPAGVSVRLSAGWPQVRSVRHCIYNFNRIHVKLRDWLRQVGLMDKEPIK